VFSNWYFVFQNNTSDTEDTNWRERQNTNWRTQDKKITIRINKTTPVIQKIPIRGKDKIPIGEVIFLSCVLQLVFCLSL
jgi:hypothetical protein